MLEDSIKKFLKQKIKKELNSDILHKLYQELYKVSKTKEDFNFLFDKLVEKNSEEHNYTSLKLLSMISIKLSKEQNLNYVYLGYWIKGSPTMEYKANFSGLELFANNKWIPLKKLNAKIYNQSSSMIEPVSKQVLNIKLPS